MKTEPTYQIKITGQKCDVLDASVLVEAMYGIHGIKRMSGILPSDNENQHFRYIEVYSHKPIKEKSEIGIVKSFFRSFKRKGI